MSDWRLEQRKQRGEHIDDTAGAREQASKVLGGLKSFFIGDTPSEMAFNAATMGALPLKALRVPMMGLSALSAADDAQAAGPLSKLARRVLGTGKGDVLDLRDLIYPYTKPRSGTPQNRQIIANYMPEQMESYPETATHAFTEDGIAKAIYQLAQRPTGTYIPNLVSFEKGYGGQALEDAYQQAKLMAPDQPAYLVSTNEPETLAFYRKQKGWVEDQEDGAHRFTRKAQGGLVEADDDFAYPGMF